MQTKSSSNRQRRASTALHSVPRLSTRGRKARPFRSAKHSTGRPPLSFEGLSWPSDAHLSGEAGDVYRASAQLFVHELLRFQDGRACLRTMLDGLPQHYNWQFAFLQGFKSHFQRLQDAEKWW